MKDNYTYNNIKQTILWMNGKPTHANNECVVDFSCCNKNLMFSHERRIEVGTKKILDAINRIRQV